ncbi:hypothetical protein ACFDTO_05715 [Microbacteriaceae bacterium 4G12]
MTDAGKRRRESIALRIVGAVLMISAEGCIFLVLFGAHAVAWTVVAAALMAVGVLAWRRGWRLGR